MSNFEHFVLYFSAAQVSLVVSANEFDRNKPLFGFMAAILGVGFAVAMFVWFFRGIF